MSQFLQVVVVRCRVAGGNYRAKGAPEAPCTAAQRRGCSSAFVIVRRYADEMKLTGGNEMHIMRM